MRNALLEIAEYVSLAGSVVGTALAVVYQQVGLAAAPVSASLLLNLASRRRLEEMTPPANGEPVLINRQLTDEIESLRASVRQLPTQQDLQGIRKALQAELQRLENAENTTGTTSTGTDVLPEHLYTSLQQTIADLNSRLENAAPASTVQQLETSLSQATLGLAQLQSELSQLQTAISNQPSSTLTEIDNQSLIPDLAQQLQQLRNALQEVQQDAENSVPKQDFLSLVEATKILEQTVTPVTDAVAQLRNQLEEISNEVNRSSGETFSTATSQQLEEIRAALDILNRRIDLQTADFTGVETLNAQNETEQISNYSYLENHLQEIHQTLGELQQRENNTVTREEFLSLAAAAHQLIEQYNAKVSELETRIPLESTTAITPIIPGQTIDYSYLETHLQEINESLTEIQDREKNTVTRQEFLSLAEAAHQLLEQYSGKVNELETRIPQINLTPAAANPTTDTPYEFLETQLQELKNTLAEWEQRERNAVDRNEFLSLAEATHQNLMQNVAPINAAIAQLRGEVETLITQIGEQTPRETFIAPATEQINLLRNDLNQLNRRVDQLPIPEPVDITGVEDVLANIAERVAETTSLGETVSDVVHRVSQLNNELEELKNQVNRNNQLMPETINQIEDLRAAIGAVNQRFDNLPLPENVDFTGVEQILENIAQTIAEAKAQTEGQLSEFHSQEITPLQENLAQLREQYSTLETNLAGVSQQVENPQQQAKIQTLETTLTNLQKSIQTLADKAEIELIVNEKVENQFGQINQILEAILSEEVKLIFDRPNIRAVLDEALENAQEKLILVSPWLNQTGIDSKLLTKFEAFLQRNGKIDLGWGNLQDIEAGELPRRLRRNSPPHLKTALYNAFNSLEQLHKKYPNQLQFKILGTHENYILRDGIEATITTQNFLASDINFPEREVAVITKDPRIVQGLIERFNEPTLTPSNAEIYRKRGAERLYIKDYQGAISDYSQSLQIDTENANVYNDRGVAFYNTGNAAAAVQDYTQALRIDPDEPTYYFNRGFASLQIGDYQGSIQDFSAVLRFLPQDADCYFHLAEAYRLAGDYQNAVENYNQALQFSPQDAVAYNNRGLSQYELGNFSQAIEDYTQALRINPDDSVTYFNRAMAACAIDQDHDALEDFNNALRLNPDYPMVYYYRAYVWIEANNRQSAKEDLQKAAQLFGAGGDSENQKLTQAVLSSLG
ncbi:tetratricopeptide repeat protein [Ancylothrix sp. C2]|uniref:tetratricopeptide repeat protein n=1 Tax=Ancylothrix sp. D3o TaxID=2953691 RepID=UPI0021BBA793|nr:tetratricopeptide repeat protein [Ancylothrix sp. D3o]MCT7948677.1 tetratricopeptide repeat protein [Ancylothrix sp. D3o]